MPRLGHVVIAGAGGNIGSHLTAHVARMERVGRVTLVDPDAYEPRNLSSQDITRADVGVRKVTVQRRRIRRIARDRVDVIAIADRVENVPVGRLSGDVILACLDSRAARQQVNQVAWRLGIPWIDAGVQPAQSLARVNVYVPSLNTACLECAWSDADYAALEQSYPCDGPSAGGDPAPTQAPSPLGALAASLQAIECGKLLAGDIERAAVGRQVLVDAASHRHYVTSFRRRESCRLRPHHPLEITRLRRGPATTTLSALFARAAHDGLGRSGLAFGIEGMRLAAEVACAGCGRRREVWRFGRAWLNGGERCRSCGGRMTAQGFDLRERLVCDERSMPAWLLERPLFGLGIRGGELCTLSTESGARHYIVGDDRV